MAAILIALVILAYSDSFQAGLVLDNEALISRDLLFHAATGKNIELMIKPNYSRPLGLHGCEAASVNGRLT